MAKDWTQDEVIKDLERVIEKQDAEIERLREALRFYADPEHYEYKVGDIAVMSNVEWNEIGLDEGAKARAALKGTE